MRDVVFCNLAYLNLLYEVIKITCFEPPRKLFFPLSNLAQHLIINL